jgi:hypothetical protein
VLHYASRLERRLVTPPGRGAPPGANSTHESSFRLTVLSRGPGFTTAIRMDDEANRKSTITLDSRGRVERVEPVDTEPERRAAALLLGQVLTPLPSRPSASPLARPGDMAPVAFEVGGVPLRGEVRVVALGEVDDRATAELLETVHQTDGDATVRLGGIVVLWRGFRSESHVVCDRRLGFTVELRALTSVDTRSPREEPGPFTASGRQETVRTWTLDRSRSRIVEDPGR